MAAGRAWTSPGVECYVCGVEQTPVALVPRGYVAIEFWALPLHRAFSGFAPGHCGGSYRLLGPVCV